MVDRRVLRKSAETTLAAVTGALASVLFYHWMQSFSWWVSGICIIIYTLFIFVVLYLFFR